MEKFVKLYAFIWTILTNSVSAGPLVVGNRATYDLISQELVIPQWLADFSFVIPKSNESRGDLRFPPEERRRAFTRQNQEIVQASQEDLQLVPSCSHVLKLHKAPQNFVTRQYYQPLRTTGPNARHKLAESRNIRWHYIGSSDEGLITLLYSPIGWPFLLIVAFVIAVFTVPLVGAVLWWVGFTVAKYYCLLFWHPLRTFLRWIVIQNELNNKRWERYIAPDHFLEPRPSFRMPYLLRNEALEEMPAELAYKPPINKIDYTMYVLNPEDYDEADLGMDELEYIDDLLQFRDQNPKAVAKLLKYKLGDEKFYHYFDEDILSDSSEDEITLQYDQEQEDEVVDRDDYLKYLDIDEPWMHEEYDATWTGPTYQLDEIRKRRHVITTMKEQIRYNHTLIAGDNKFEMDYVKLTSEERAKLQRDTKKYMDKYAKFSRLTKQRIEELEPSAEAQMKRNPALSKYLPLVDRVSHYNHRLNLKHEKQSDEARRRLQLEVFGGP